MAKREEHPDSNAWSPQTLSAWVVTPSGRRHPAWLVRWSSCNFYNWLRGESSHYASQALRIFCASSCSFSRGDFLFLAVQHFWSDCEMGGGRGEGQAFKALHRLASIFLALPFHQCPYRDQTTSINHPTLPYTFTLSLSYSHQESLCYYSLWT